MKTGSKFLNVFKSDENKKELVSVKTKNSAGRTIAGSRSRLNGYNNQLTSINNGLTTQSLAAQVVRELIEKLSVLIKSVLVDETVGAAHDQNK
jgi:hypothetical protein